MRSRVREASTAYAMLLPSFIGVALFVFVPVVFALALSFQKWNLIGDPSWVGLENYGTLFSSGGFWNSIGVTIAFTVFSIPTMMAGGLLIAVALNRKLPGSRIMQTIYVIPWVSAPVVIGLVWKWMFDPSYGVINELTGVRVEWLSSLSLALPAVAFVYVWSGVGYVSLFFLAGLQAIPPYVYEAAQLDGAGAFSRLFRITLPLLRPTTFFVLVTTVVSSFQVFDVVYAMTEGGPARATEVIAAKIYFDAFQNLNFGSAAATAFVLFLILVVVTLVQHLYYRRRTTYDLA